MNLPILTAEEFDVNGAQRVHVQPVEGLVWLLIHKDVNQLPLVVVIFSIHGDAVGPILLRKLPVQLRLHGLQLLVLPQSLVEHGAIARPPILLGPVQPDLCLLCVHIPID